MCEKSITCLNVCISEFDKYHLVAHTSTVVYEYRSVVGGVQYNTNKIKPRLNCELREKTSGKQISLSDAWIQDSNYELASRSGTLLMVFEVDRPDTYLLSCYYTDSREEPKVVLAIGTNLLPNVVSLALSAVVGFLTPVPLLCCGTFMAGLIVCIVAVMRHRNARRIAGDLS